MTGRADCWIRRTTIGSVSMLAMIAGTVSYLHMHELVVLHGQPGWVAALTPVSVDGMIVAASTTLLSDSRSGARGGMLPWLLLAVGSIASLAANVAVAEPSVAGRVIAAWPSFALIGSYEMLMRQIRRTATASIRTAARPSLPGGRRGAPSVSASARADVERGPANSVGVEVRRSAWEWAVANRTADGSRPSGKAIAARYERHERWGRLVKRSGMAGEFASGLP
jgi:hypothetical protein